jgi:hypothetical protein
MPTNIQVVPVVCVQAASLLGTELTLDAIWTKPTIDPVTHVPLQTISPINVIDSNVNAIVPTIVRICHI